MKNVFKTYTPVHGHDYGYNIKKANRTRPTKESNIKRSESLKGKNIGLTIEQCLEIKRMLLEETNELQKEKEIRLASKFNITARTIGKIIRGEYWCSDQLGGSLKDWTGFSWYKLYSEIKDELNKPTKEKIGEKDKRIAKQFGVSVSTVGRLRTNIIELKNGEIIQPYHK